MAGIIQWIFDTAGQLWNLVTGNWYLLIFVGLFVAGAVLGLLFKIFGKKSSK